jgi:hypothetical protein
MRPDHVVHRCHSERGTAQEPFAQGGLSHGISQQVRGLGRTIDSLSLANRREANTPTRATTARTARAPATT